ncbi:MAG TPA: ABC transporter ATP-binding protein [Acidimicrobiales bacterium]|nr:ABC transporter ATP-binding protein [Acidimicrobiales bacterium]
MTVPAIEVVDVSKRFRVYNQRPDSLKERITSLHRIHHEDFWALKNVNVTVPKGSVYGLVGHNGSGKSTLLKCIAGILQPTHGQISVRGRLAALLELGAGFHPELTGRENVFLNASILGMPRKEIDKRFDEIVAFAELEQFIDNQVKHYSSGMYVRLGFAVAVNMDPEILLVDEVLAVGDESFQRKCLERVRRFQREGRTIVFVTHAADLVRQICDRAAVLDHGRMVALGAPGEAVRAFREHLMQGERFEEAATLDVADDSPRPPTQEEKRNLKVEVTDVAFDYPGAGERRYLLPGEPLAVRISYNAREPVDDVVFGLGIHDQEGRQVFGSNTDFLGIDVGVLDGPGVVTFQTDSVPLLDGTYLLTIGVHSHDEATVYDWLEHRHQFEVMNPHRTSGSVYMGIRASIEKRKGQGAA